MESTTKSQSVPMNDDNSLDDSLMSSFGKLSSSGSGYQLDSLCMEIGQLKLAVKKAELDAREAKVEAKEAKQALAAESEKNDRLRAQFAEDMKQLELQRIDKIADRVARQQDSIAGHAKKLDHVNASEQWKSAQRLAVLDMVFDEQNITEKLTRLQESVDRRSYVKLLVLYIIAFTFLIAVGHDGYRKITAAVQGNEAVLISKFDAQMTELWEQLAGNITHLASKLDTERAETEIKLQELADKHAELEQQMANIVNYKTDKLEKHIDSKLDTKMKEQMALVYEQQEQIKVLQDEFGQKMATKLDSKNEQEIEDSAVVIPLSLGIELFGGEMRPFIQRNTTIPSFASAIFTFQTDNFLIRVYEGERVMAKDNKLLGIFQLWGIHSSQVEVTFAVDANGILHVFAQNLATGGMLNSIAINTKMNLKNKEEAERHVLEAEQHRTEDESVRDSMYALNSYLLSIKQTMVDEGVWSRARGEDWKKMRDMWDETLSWLSDINKQENTAGREEFEWRYKELQAVWVPIITKLRQEKMLQSGHSFVLRFLTNIFG